MGILSFVAMFSFANGYYAICLGPGHNRKLRIYQITQGLLCLSWFIFAIVGAGPLDGFTKFKYLKICNLGFSIFLGVVEDGLYFSACGLGVYCIITSIKL